MTRKEKTTNVYIVWRRTFDWPYVLKIYKKRERAERHVEQLKKENKAYRNPGWGEDRLEIEEYEVEDLYEQ